MLEILCIDPGTTESGYVVIDEDGDIYHKGVVVNGEMLGIINLNYNRFDHILIEMVASYGMPVGRSTFDTVLWVGRFMELSRYPAILVTRKDVKKTISSGQAKDPHIRQAIIDRYEPTGGGKTPQIGTKKQPGPLYGMKSHMWAALALGLAYLDGCDHYEPTKPEVLT